MNMSPSSFFRPAKKFGTASTSPQKMSKWISHISSSHQLFNKDSIVFSLRNKEDAILFNKSWLDIRVHKDGVATGIGISINAEELGWMSQKVFRLINDHSDSNLMTFETNNGERKLTFEICSAKTYNYTKISVETAAKTYRICFPKSDLPDILVQLINYRRLFKFSEVAQKIDSKILIKTMIAAAVRHPFFMDKELKDIKTEIETVDTLEARFKKALDFFGYHMEGSLSDVTFDEDDWLHIKAIHLRNAFMGATENEIKLVIHADFLFKQAQIEN